METFEEFASSCNLMSFENDQISKQSTIHMPISTYETSFLSDGLLTSIPNLSTSVSNDLNSPYINTSRAIFTIHLPSSQILVVNSTACQLLNYSSDELCSLKLGNLINESYKHKLSNLYEKFLESSGETHSNGKLLEFVKKDNETISGLIYLKKIDNPGRCLAIVEPLERKLGLMSIDQNGSILSCEEETGLIFQYDSSDIIGLSIYTLLPTIDLKKKNDGKWKNISRQQITGRTKYGASFPISVDISSRNPSRAEECKITIWMYTSLNALMILNKRLLITNFNNHIIKLLIGFSKNDILNQPVFHLIPTFCKNIACEKNKNSCYQSSNLNETSECWYEKNDSFDDWDENFISCDHVSATQSEGPTPFVNFTCSSKLREGSPSSVKVDYEVDHGLKTLFKHERNREGIDEQKSVKKYGSSFSNGDHFEEKLALNPILIKTGRSNFDPANNIFECCPANNQNVLVQEGKFNGFAKHSDGNCIAIKYKVNVVAVNEECFYYVWLSNDSSRRPDVNKRLNTNMVFSFNNTSIDSSLHKDSVCSEQCTRPSTASLISQSDETLTAGDYSQNYTNIRQIGKGAFGYVKMAFRNSDGLLVVTKFIKKQKISVRSWVFHSNLNMKIPLEISLLTTLQHPNIVKVLDVFHNDSFVQLVMEKHGAGFDLFEFINRGPNCDEKLKSYIFRQIISAVHYLDSLGILHRDIKDENVIINEKFEIKLIDFGSATFIPPNEFFSKFYGTVEYCSPEVLQGNTYKGPELEIWALGVTLYVLTFGDNPFHSIEETIKGQFSIPFPISKELNNLLNQMLDRNIETRITICKVVEDPWINQPVCIENYRFQDVVQSSDEEAYPPKYVHEINSEDLYERRDSRTDSNVLGHTNNSYGSLQNLAEMDDLDDNFQQIPKCCKSERSGSKISIPSLMLSSTPVRWRKDRLSKSASGVPDTIRNSSALSDCSCECRDESSIEKESLFRNNHLKHFKSSSSSESDCSGDVKEEMLLPGYNDFWESDMEMRLKNCRLVEQENFEMGKSPQAEKLRNVSEVYELANENRCRKYLGSEDNSGNECFSPN